MKRRKACRHRWEEYFTVEKEEGEKVFSMCCYCHIEKAEIRVYDNGNWHSLMDKWEDVNRRGGF